MACWRTNKSETSDTYVSSFSMTLQGYDGRWTATDQIPERAVLDRSLDRYGYMDPTNGGDPHRYRSRAIATPIQCFMKRKEQQR
jgi:hypothetical protein